LIVRHNFTPHNNTRMTHLCGPMDAHLRTIEAGLQVKIAHRHEQFKIDGPKAKANQALELLQALYEMADRPIKEDSLQLMMAGDPEVANNPDVPNKPVAIMMVYNNTPASVMALKKSGIKTPADLAGKKLGAPVFDAGRRAFPIFQKANNIGNVAWTAMDPPLRETMLVRGDVDAITGFTFTSLLNIEARGVKADDVVVMQYPDFGVKLYGNVIIASPKILKENPAAVKAFLSAFTKGAKDVIANPAAAIADVKARDGIINVELETRRLQLAIDTVINSPSAREEGFGQVKGPRLALMASQVSDAFNTKTRIKADDVWNGSFLPSAKELDILPKPKK